MIYSIISRAIKYFRPKSQLVDKRYEDEFIHTTMLYNLNRQKKMSIFLVIWDILMAAYLVIAYTNGAWTKFPNYKYLFIIHIIFVIYFSFHVGLIHYSNKRFKNKNNIFNKFINLLFIFVFFELLAISWNFSDFSIANYGLGLFIVAFIFQVKFRDMSVLCIISYITLIGVGFLTNKSNLKIEEAIIEGMVDTIICLLISNMSYYYYKRDFISNKLIHEKSLELENMNNILEQSVNERTRELMESNNQLIDEINKRHELEVQAFKADFERKEAEEKLIEVQKFDRLREDFFSNISHELRTPINIIFSSIQMFKLLFDRGDIDSNKEKIYKYLSSMRQNCFRLIRLINNLIDISKIDAGFLTPKFSNNDIVRLIENITSQTAQYIENSGIDLIFTSSVKSKIISCDPELIERVMLNLLSNAVKYTDKSGNIRVDVYLDDQDIVYISVKDSGVGIPEDRIDSIFKRFVQVDQSTKTREGSGIGLSLVKSVVDMHNGKITVKSKVSEGTEFIIHLPDVLVEKESTYINSTSDNINIEFSDIC